VKLLAFRTFGDDQIEIVLHPRVTVITGLDARRRARVAAALAAMLQGDVGAGEAVFDIDGVRLPLTDEVWRDLEVPIGMPTVLSAADLPGARIIGRAAHRAVAAVAAVAAVPDPPAEPEPIVIDDAPVRDAEQRLDETAAALDAQRAEVANVAGAQAQVARRRESLAASLAAAEARVAPLVTSRPRSITRITVAPSPPPDVPAQLLADAGANLEAARRELDEAKRHPTASDPDMIAALEAAHGEVLEAEERTGLMARRRLANAMAREQAILREMGMPSYGAYLLRTSVVDAHGPETRMAQARLALADAQAVWDELHAGASAAPAFASADPAAAEAEAVEAAAQAAQAAERAAAAAQADEIRGRLADADDELLQLTREIGDLRQQLIACELAHDASAEELARARSALEEQAAPAPDTMLDLRPAVPLVVPEPVAVDAGGVDADDLEIFLLSRLLTHRSAGGRTGSLPIVVDDAFRGLDTDAREGALALLARMSAGVQVVYLTDRPEIELWAFAQGPEDASAVGAPALANGDISAGSPRVNAG